MVRPYRLLDPISDENRLVLAEFDPGSACGGRVGDGNELRIHSKGNAFLHNVIVTLEGLS